MYNDDQWGAQQGYKSFAPPGPSPGYSQPYAQPINPPPQFNEDTKSPYEGGRFQPKKRVNDPIFLVLFILQVGGDNLSSCWSLINTNDFQLLAFAAVSAIAINGWIKIGGLGGGVGGNGESGSAVTLNWSVKCNTLHPRLLRSFSCHQAYSLPTIISDGRWSSAIC